MKLITLGSERLSSMPRYHPREQSIQLTNGNTRREPRDCGILFPMAVKISTGIFCAGENR